MTSAETPHPTRIRLTAKQIDMAEWALDAMASYLADDDGAAVDSPKTTCLPSMATPSVSRTTGPSRTCSTASRSRSPTWRGTGPRSAAQRSSRAPWRLRSAMSRTARDPRGWAADKRAD